MTKDEALDLALEALEDRSSLMKWQKAITAIKKVRALDKMAENARELGLDYEPAEVLGHNGWGFPIKAAAPVQEDWGPGPHECHSLTASVQEPVAFFDPQGKGFYWAKPTKITAPVTVDVEPLPLYTTPPAAKRQWVDLTDEEIYALESATDTLEFPQTVKAIEAKLKELNT